MRSRIELPPFSPSKDLREYPFFKGQISRFVWMIFTQLLTPAGRWFAFISMAFISYSGTSFYLQGYVLGTYAGSIWLIATIAVLMYRPRVRLTAHHVDRVCAGETMPVDLEIEQLKGGRGADLVVLPHRLHPTIDAIPDGGVMLPDLARNQVTKARLRLKCHKRGAYTLHGFRVETQFPFGILRSRSVFYEERQLLVYPKFNPLSRLILPTGRRYQPGGVALASEVGESFEYKGNREYREGDNVRDIDWRATARINQPIVREWVEEYMLRVGVVLDTHVPAGLSVKALEKRRESFERAVSVAAATSDYMARQDYLVDLFAAGPNLYHLTAGRSLAYLDQILEILACVDESRVEPFDIIEPQIAELLSRISTVICVMLDWDDARRQFIHRLRTQGVAMKVIILHDGRCTIDPAADAELLGGIPVISSDEFDRGIEEL